MDLFSPRHLLIILLICLVVFGTKKLRTIGADLGGAVRGFKGAMNEAQQEPEAEAAKPAAPAPAAAADAARIATAPAAEATAKAEEKSAHG
jgi:sec-independent protein translocase protein TatA